MRKLDNMHYLFNKFHSSDVFVMISFEKFQNSDTVSVSDTQNF